MDKITTTLAKIKAQSPCEYGYKKLVKSLGGIRKYGIDTPITFQQIYVSNGCNDTLWCLRATDKQYHYLWRHFAVDAAQSVEHLNADKGVSDCNAVIRRHADDNATETEIGAARDAAWDAAWDAARAAAWAATRDAAGDAAWDAARAAAWAAAWAAAGDAAWDAARAAAGDAARAAAWAAARDAAEDAARDAVREAQMRLLFDYCREGKRPDNSDEVLKRYIAEANTAQSSWLDLKRTEAKIEELIKQREIGKIAQLQAKLDRAITTLKQVEYSLKVIWAIDRDKMQQLVTNTLAEINNESYHNG